MVAITTAVLMACQIVVGIGDRELDIDIADAGSLVDADASPCGDVRSNPENCGYCGHACDACDDGVCAYETVLSGLTFARTFAIDEKNIYVLASGELQIFDKNTRARTYVHQLDAGYPTSVAAIDGRAYWSNTNPNEWLVSDGQDTKRIFSQPDKATIGRVAVRGDQLFWAIWQGGARKIKSGADFAVLVPDQDAGGYSSANSIALTPEEIFAGDSVTATVHRVFADGGVEPFFRQLKPNGMLVHEGFLYLGDTSFPRRVPVTNNTTSEAVTPTNGAVYSIRYAKGRILASCVGNFKDTEGNVISVPVEGGARAFLARGQPNIGDILIDGDWVYWITGLNNSKVIGEIRRVRL